jgi:hypothetical protein
MVEVTQYLLPLTVTLRSAVACTQYGSMFHKVHIRLYITQTKQYEHGEQSLRSGISACQCHVLTIQPIDWI